MKRRDFLPGLGRGRGLVRSCAPKGRTQHLDATPEYYEWRTYQVRDDGKQNRGARRT